MTSLLNVLAFTSTLPTFIVILLFPDSVKVAPFTSLLKISLVVLIIAFDKSSAVIANVFVASLSANAVPSFPIAFTVTVPAFVWSEYATE